MKVLGSKNIEVLCGFNCFILLLMQQPDQSDIPVPPKEKKFKGYFKIARHYGWALNYTFFRFNFDTVIIVEGKNLVR
jgi:hypothetical protein